MFRSLVLLLGSLTLVYAWGGKVPSTHRLDSSWKRYSNDDIGYCVSYPSRWLRGEAFDGAGMYFETGLKKYSRPAGEMDISAFSGIQTVDYLRTHLEGLKRFERARNLKVLDQREMPLLGSTALFTKDSYSDPLDKTEWIDEIVLASSGKMLYRLELECRKDQIGRFEPLFEQFVQSFRLQC
ncbi:MAG TPA: hypothetical protein VG273_17410 [Bryobacteraceae bacterium]|jgi:hypothetical protein|nr:hypothetical protein [Bryobacteraceae bacterium]